MKQLYTLVGALVISGAAFGQGPVQKINHSVHAKSTTLRSADKTEINTRKGTPLYSNDLSVAGDWTINNDAGNNDDWVIGTGVPAGSFAIAGIQSTTAANGFGLFDSDLLCSGSQDANLQITNSIDLSSSPNVKFEFEQYYRKYQGFTYLEISTDGSTWTQFEVNDTYAVNDASATNPELVSVNISAATQSSATVWFRFKYVGGCDYAWMVDDINIWDAPDDELTLGGIGYASATQDPYSGNYITYHNYPINQISPVHFSSYICNVGSLGQTNVEATYAVPSESFTATSPAASQAAATCDSVDGQTDWTPSSSVAAHQIDFGINYDNVANEATPGNNINTATIAVSQGTYETYPNDWGGSGLWNGDDGAGNTTAFEMGNNFQILADDTISAINAVFSSNTTVGTIAYAVLYSVDLTSGDFNYEQQSNDITLSAADLASTGPDPVRVIFEMPTPQPVAAGEMWLAVIGHYGGQDEMILGNGNGPVDDQTVFLLDGADNTWYYLGSNPMVGLEMSNSDVGVGIDEASASGIELYQNTPNPFNGTTKISYEIATAGNVTFTIYDLAGKKVMDLNEGSKAAGAYQIQLNGADFAAGSYYYTLRVGEQQVTKQMVITK